MSLLTSLLTSPARFRATRAYIRRLPTYVRRPPARTSLYPKYRFKAGREAFVFSNAIGERPLGRSPKTSVAPAYSVSNNKSTFLEIGDNRRFHPLGSNRPLLTLSKGAARWVYPPGPSGPVHVPVYPSRLSPFTTKPIVQTRYQGLERLRFDNSRDVVICLKRRIRREVMNALGLAGLRGFSRPRYNFDSKVIC